MTFNSVGIIGGGAWGTALAQTARLAGRDALLWALEADVVAEINARHANTPFLPGVPLDAGLRATGKLADIAALRRGADGGAGPARARHRRCSWHRICRAASRSSCAPRAWSSRPAS